MEQYNNTTISMNKLIIIIYITAFCLLSAVNCPAQDSHLSQYYASPLSINPALTGMMEGSYRLSGIYRSQWSSFTNSFITATASFDIPVNKWGFGMYIKNNSAGKGHISTFNALLSVGYNLALDVEEHHHLAFGMQTGFMQKKIEPDKLEFGDQWVQGTQQLQPSNETFINTQILKFDMNIGIYWHYLNRADNFNPFFGLSFNHLTTPDESFNKTELSSLPRKYLLHGGSKIFVSEIVTLTPQILVMNQGPANEFIGSLLSKYSLENAAIIAGVSYRNKDAVVIHTGLQYQEMNIGISYDINTSSLRTGSNGQGGFEISIIYMAIDQKSKNAKFE